MSECITLVKGDYICVIPKGATNGEVIKALFPNIELVEIYNSKHRFFLKGREMEIFDLKAHVDWWNAPYKEGGE